MHSNCNNVYMYVWLRGDLLDRFQCYMYMHKVMRASSQKRGVRVDWHWELGHTDLKFLYGGATPLQVNPLDGHLRVVLQTAGHLNHCSSSTACNSKTIVLCTQVRRNYLDVRVLAPAGLVQCIVGNFGEVCNWVKITKINCSIQYTYVWY